MTLLTRPAPKPDGVTGEPRPPQAPVEPTWKPYDKASDLGPGLPPPGKGPALEWFADARRTMWAAAAFLFTLGVVLVSVRDGGFEWMSIWWMWLVMAGAPSLFLFGRRAMRMTAGADWLSIGDKQWVDTYRLRGIRVTESIRTRHLELTDAAGNKVDTQVWYLQKNRRLWDLLYNGILHSIVYHGADVNRLAVEHLQLQAVIQKPPIDRAHEAGRKQQKRRLILSPILCVFFGVLGYLTAPSVLFFWLGLGVAVLLSPLVAKVIDRSERGKATASAQVGGVGGALGGVGLAIVLPHSAVVMFGVSVIGLALCVGLGISAWGRLRR